MYRERLLRHIAFRIDVAVERLPRRHAVEYLNATELNQTIASQRIQAGGFGIENDFAHALS
jgi:hypothetical protein